MYIIILDMKIFFSLASGLGFKINIIPRRIIKSYCEFIITVLSSQDYNYSFDHF